MENTRSKRNISTRVRFCFTFEGLVIYLRYFSSIDNIRSTLEFPPKEAFYSKLKQEAVNDDDYNEAKRLYETRRQLRLRSFMLTIKR